MDVSAVEYMGKYHILLRSVCLLGVFHPVCYDARTTKTHPGFFFLRWAKEEEDKEVLLSASTT